MLSASDHLTDEATVDFWRRYFANYKYNNVNLDWFCDAIQSEFSALIFNPVLNEISEDSGVNNEDLMNDFYISLMNKVSIDQNNVSLNAL